MTLPSFIIEHLEKIVTEWESFAKTVLPAATAMDSLALRDHAKEMLEAIAKDIESSQSDQQQVVKSTGRGPVFHGAKTAAASHGLVRHTAGFELPQLVAEFRALRATVLRQWAAATRDGDPASTYEMTRFNEAVDQALAESVAAYSKELSGSRDTFLAILGDDLRNPLSTLADTLRTLSKPGDAASRAEALAEGTSSVSAMDAMIRDLLEYTRTRLGGGIPITPVEANLETVCKAAIGRISLAHPQTAFRFESGGKLDGVFDSARIHQVVTNLLSYAVQRGKRGVPVFLIAHGTKDSLAFKVRYQDLPIATEALQVIFEPLARNSTDGSDQRRSTNPGLSLFIAREIVRAHGGTIHASSAADTGTTFTVELPRANHA